MQHFMPCVHIDFHFTTGVAMLTHNNFSINKALVQTLIVVMLACHHSSNSNKAHFKL